MNNDKISNGHYLALTTIAYDGDIRIPCEVIEKGGLVRCVSFKLKYMPWFASRSIVKGLKFIMFPKKICKSKAVIEAIISA